MIVVCLFYFSWGTISVFDWPWLGVINNLVIVLGSFKWAIFHCISQLRTLQNAYNRDSCKPWRPFFPFLTQCQRGYFSCSDHCEGYLLHTYHASLSKYWVFDRFWSQGLMEREIWTNDLCLINRLPNDCAYRI